MSVLRPWPRIPYMATRPGTFPLASSRHPIGDALIRSPMSAAATASARSLMTSTPDLKGAGASALVTGIYAPASWPS